MLLMDVKSVFNHVSRNRLLRRIDAMLVDRDVAR